MNKCIKKQPPTDKQIQFVDDICRALRIDDFPFTSSQYNKYHYGKFIQAHIEEYKEFVGNAIDSVADEDYLMDICENDVWCEHY